MAIRIQINQEVAFELSQADKLDAKTNIADMFKHSQ